MRGFDAIVVGGGAAGLFCAAQLGARGKRVLVLEKAKQVGRKILMSGGGRCNFTNMYAAPENYLSNNPHFCKSALNRYTPWDFIALVAEQDIPYHEKKLGQLFCDRSAKDILNLLLAQCVQHQVEIQTRCGITELDASMDYRLETNLGRFHSDVLVVASGGLSIPSMGVSGWGYQVAEQMGMRLQPRRAGLVPFTFSDDFKILAETISGVSVDSYLYNNETGFRENILFTHRGLSGPAALQLSSYWQPGEAVCLNLLPDLDVEHWLLASKTKHPKSLLKSLLTEYLPKALVAQLENRWWLPQARKPLGEISNQALQALAKNLQEWSIRPAGTEGYRTAEVTLGGVDTQALSSKTMESNTRPGLFFIGEVVDVTGHLGGYNFQWAWSSAYACGQSI